MNFSASNYKIGDRIRIFSTGNTFAPGNFVTGTVKKITASGQMTVDVKGTERRFTARGREVGQDHGGWSNHCPWLANPEEAEDLARKIAAENAQLNLKRETRAELDRLSKLDPIHEGEALVKGLRDLADKLVTS